MQPAASGVIAAAVIRRQKKIVAAFRVTGAVSSATAVTPASLGVSEKKPFRQLCGHGVLREASSGQFYFDEASWSALLVKRRRYALTAVAVMVVAVLIVYALQRSLD